MSNDQIQSGEQRAPWPPAGTRVYVSEPGGARPNGQYPPRPLGQMAGWRSPAWAAAAPVGLSPRDADRSRKWRTLIGVSSLILGAFAAFYAGLSVIALDRAGRELAVALAVTVGIYGLGAAAYIGAGIWNVVARRSTAIAPLVVAIVLAGIAILLILLSLAESAAMGRVPQLGGLAMNALILGRSIMALRIKRVPNLVRGPAA